MLYSLLWSLIQKLVQLVSLVSQDRVDGLTLELEIGPALVRLLKAPHLRALLCWPEQSGGGKEGRRQVLTLVSSILCLWNSSPSTSEKEKEALIEARSLPTSPLEDITPAMRV